MLERHRPDAVKRGLRGLGHAEAGEQRGDEADHERDRAALQRVKLDLIADDRELAQHRLLDRLLRARVALEHEPAHDHFGSKDNLLLALLDEHLSVQIAEQVEAFDASRATFERPRAGAEKWMQGLEQDPDGFRLFVELWVHAQRDEQLRGRLGVGMEALRATFRELASRRASEQDFTAPPELVEQVSNVMLALGVGLGMIKLVDPDSVPPQLLGAVLVVLLRSLETSEEARTLLAEAAQPPQRSGAQAP